MAYRIRELREKNKLTQEQLAQMSGVSRTTKRYFGNTRKDTGHRERYTFRRSVYWGSERSEHPL